MGFNNNNYGFEDLKSIVKKISNLSELDNLGLSYYLKTGEEVSNLYIPYQDGVIVMVVIDDIDDNTIIESILDTYKADKEDIERLNDTIREYNGHIREMKNIMDKI